MCVEQAGSQLPSLSGQAQAKAGRLLSPPKEQIRVQGPVKAGLGIGAGTSRIPATLTRGAGMGAGKGRSTATLRAGTEIHRGDDSGVTMGKAVVSKRLGSSLESIGSGVKLAILDNAFCSAQQTSF